MTDASSDFLDYEISDVEAYATLLRGADVEVSQLEPGLLRGHHLRVGLPGGEISWIQTNIPMRGRGHFPPNVWTLSVVLGAASHAHQHGIAVRSGTLFLHRPKAEHDGIYGRDFSVVCLCVSDEILAETVKAEFPELTCLWEQKWRVWQPAEAKRVQLIDQFQQAATILRNDPDVRGSGAAKASMQDELLTAFLETLADEVAVATDSTVSNAAALIHQAETLAAKLDGHADINRLTVRDLCVGCGVPRRTLSHAFQQVLGMGPATYLRRMRLNQVRRLLRRARINDSAAIVTKTALEHGFWHLGRFSSQYREMFGECPLETSRRSSRATTPTQVVAQSA
jgi:AraC family ethanolamine operon transcriptional activator